MNARTAVLVASSAPPGLKPQVDPAHAGPDERAAIADWHTLYSGGVADALTFHSDRDTGQQGGAWRPVRELWKLQFSGDGIPRVWINNEPIGPQSSVDSDDDPVRLAMSAAMSWLSGMAAYTLHTGAGVRGGGAADRDLGRAVNLWEVPNIDATTRMLQAVRQALPATLPNWQRVNWNASEHPCAITAEQADREVFAHVAARQGERFVMASFGHASPVQCTARGASTLQVWQPPFAKPTQIEVPQGAPVRLNPPAQLTIRN
jgi:hypothetical protein